MRIFVKAAVLGMAGSAALLGGCASPVTDEGIRTFAGVPVPSVRAPNLPLIGKRDRGPSMYPGGDMSGAEPAFADIGYSTWDPVYEAPYRFYVGDEVELSAPGAAEVNKTVTVSHDGRASFPYVGEVMLANRSVEDVRTELRTRYARELRNPNVQLTVKPGPIKIFVGGEVNNANVYDLIGDGNALNAVIQAGGFKTSADLRHVIVIRRGKGDNVMMRTTDLSEALRHGWQPDLVPLQRGDIVFVPRSGIAKVGLFMQQYFRDALPISFSYAINNRVYANQ